MCFILNRERVYQVIISTLRRHIHCEVTQRIGEKGVVNWDINLQIELQSILGQLQINRYYNSEQISIQNIDKKSQPVKF